MSTLVEVRCGYCKTPIGLVSHLRLGRALFTGHRIICTAKR